MAFAKQNNQPTMKKNVVQQYINTKKTNIKNKKKEPYATFFVINLI